MWKFIEFSCTIHLFIISVLFTVKNLKIGTRLGGGFAAILTLLVILISTTLMHMHEVSEATNQLVNTSVKNEQKAAEWAKIIELNGLLIEMAY